MSRFSRLVDVVQFRVCVAHWSWLPAPVWFVVASPLLHWALGGPESRWFAWPLGCSRSPFRVSFWCVGRGATRR